MAPWAQTHGSPFTESSSLNALKRITPPMTAAHNGKGGIMQLCPASRRQASLVDSLIDRSNAILTRSQDVVEGSMLLRGPVSMLSSSIPCPHTDEQPASTPHPHLSLFRSRCRTARATLQSFWQAPKRSLPPSISISRTVQDRTPCPLLGRLSSPAATPTAILTMSSEVAI